jgi:hypothetical protein
MFSFGYSKIWDFLAETTSSEIITDGELSERDLSVLIREVELYTPKLEEQIKSAQLANGVYPQRAARRSKTHKFR